MVGVPAFGYRFDKSVTFSFPYDDVVSVSSAKAEGKSSVISFGGSGDLPVSNPRLLPEIGVCI